MNIKHKTLAKVGKAFGFSLFPLYATLVYFRLFIVSLRRFPGVQMMDAFFTAFAVTSLGVSPDLLGFPNPVGLMVRCLNAFDMTVRHPVRDATSGFDGCVPNVTPERVSVRSFYQHPIPNGMTETWRGIF